MSSKFDPKVEYSFLGLGPTLLIKFDEKRTPRVT